MPNLGGAGPKRVKAWWSKNGDRLVFVLFIPRVESSAPRPSAAVEASRKSPGGWRRQCSKVNFRSSEPDRLRAVIQDGATRSPALPILRRIFLIFFCIVISHDDLQIAEK